MFAVFLATVTGFAIGPPASYPAMAGAAVDDAIDPESGARIFSRSCVSCHGADGKGKTRRGRRKGAADLTKSKISVSKGLRIITHGRGSMPKFKKTLSRAEIRRVNQYVRSLRK